MHFFDKKSIFVKIYLFYSKTFLYLYHMHKKSNFMKKIELEYIINSSPGILFNRLSTGSGLEEWFADEVNIDGDTYKFVWNGVEEPARMLTLKNMLLVRFRWLEAADPDTYFEFKIKQHALTNDVSLFITDFAADDEYDDAVALWEAQVNKLKHVLGA